MIPALMVGGVGALLHPWIGIGLFTLAVVGVLAYISALDAIYRVALYRHATSAAPAKEFSLVGFDDAFKTKKRRWL